MPGSAFKDVFARDLGRRKKILAFGVLWLLAILLLAPMRLLTVTQAAQEQFVSSELGSSALVVIDRPAAVFAKAAAKGLHMRYFLNSQKKLFREHGRVFVAGLYVVLWRLIFICFVVLLSLGVLWAAWYDGWRRRKISQWRYEYSSPVRHFVARNWVARLIDTALFCAVLPLPLPPVAVLAWAVATAIALRTWAANMQQRM